MMSAEEYAKQQRDPEYRRLRGVEIFAASQSAALQKIMRRIGIVGATPEEIAEQVCKRLDGAQAVIDQLRKKRSV